MLCHEHRLRHHVGSAAVVEWHGCFHLAKANWSWVSTLCTSHPGWLIAEKVLNSAKAVGLRISLVLSHCRKTFRCFQMRLEEGHPYEAVASEVLQAWREHASV